MSCVKYVKKIWVESYRKNGDIRPINKKDRHSRKTAGEGCIQDYITIKVCSVGKSDRRRDVTPGNPLRPSEWGFKHRWALGIANPKISSVNCWSVTLWFSFVNRWSVNLKKYFSPLIRYFSTR